MFIPTLRITIFLGALTLLTGVVYPLLVTALAGMAFPYQAGGSLVEKDGKVVGSSLIAQEFEGEGYFHPRPSGAGAGYEANNSGASNLSVTSKALQESYTERVADLGPGDIPVDLITASGSGLDPHITPDAANFQAVRVATARNLAVDRVQALIEQHTEGRSFGLLGQPRVNVLALNLALDKMGQATETME